MKKICSLILTVILITSMISAASAAGYTLPEKMQRQLEVGSGLKGSFVIHANADAELSPFIHSVQNAEYEIRGIQFEGNKHYYIYQPGENEAMNSLTEYCTKEGTEYLRSDFLEGNCYQLPAMDHLINSWLNSEGENPSVFPELLRMIFSGTDEEMSTEGLERQIEVWISSFSTESTVQSSDGMPRLSQTFRIPVEDLYSAAAELVKTISSDEAYMGFLRETLSREQIDTYLNPNLGYYYIDAMKQLNMGEEIVFTRTVSTLGELIQSSLVLPLDPEKTGFDSLTLENSETIKSFLVTGPKGVVYLELPAEFDIKEEVIENAQIRFAMIDRKNEKSKNVALKIILSKKSDKFEDAEDGRVHANEDYTVQFSRSLEGMPDAIEEDLIPDMAEANAEIAVHWSSKSQLSSPTTLELSVRIEHGRFNFDMEGKLKTSSPWVFTPFSTDSAENAENFTSEDFEKLKEEWIRNAEEKITRTEEEIPAKEETASPETADGTGEDPTTTAETGEAEPVEINENETDDSGPND